MIADREEIEQSINHLNEAELQQVVALLDKLRSSGHKNQRLSDFYGALSATQPYPGRDAIRQTVAADLAKAIINSEYRCTRTNGIG